MKVMVFLLPLVMLLAMIPATSISASMPTPMAAIYLYSACKDTDSSDYARGFCDGAIDALYSSIENWCVPEDVTHGEVRTFIKNKLLASIPPVLTQARDFVTTTVNDKWPCP